MRTSAFDEALVEPLVAPRDEQQARRRRELARERLVERPALRREHDLPRAGRQSRAQRAHGVAQRLVLQHHARPAAVRPIVDRPVPVGREVARRHVLEREQAALARAPDDADARHRRDELRKQRDDPDTVHPLASQNSGDQSATITPAARSTPRITAPVHERDQPLRPPREHEHVVSAGRDEVIDRTEPIARGRDHLEPFEVGPVVLAGRALGQRRALDRRCPPRSARAPHRDRRFRAASRPRSRPAHARPRPRPCARRPRARIVQRSKPTTLSRGSV